MIYFISDAHLGSPTTSDDKEHQNKLIALLEQMSKDATAIYMLGGFKQWTYARLDEKGNLEIKNYN